jgi:NTP pyrophosphatase (non-canonical NTP hydrolase)
MVTSGQTTTVDGEAYSPGRRNLAREEAILALKAELAFQKAKHGRNEMFFFKNKLSVLIEEVGEVGHAINEAMDASELYKELIQVAACAIAWAERLNCDKYANE